MVRDDDIRAIALGLPGSFEQSSHGGRPSWRTKPRMFAWLREDPEALVVWVESEDEKRALIESDPERLFTTGHYEGSPIVLVRPNEVDADEARELVTESWRLRAPRTLVREWDSAHPEIT